MRWNRRFAYLNSAHSLLPRRLNDAWDGPGDPRLSGVLLHTKFMPDVIARSREDRQRRQHFAQPLAYDDYHDALLDNPDLWHPGAQHLNDWHGLVAQGLMSIGSWK